MADKGRIRRSDSILDYLGLAIASGQIAEGDLIPTEAELMDQFQVGRSSVREAIAALVGHGMLTASPRRGTVVNERLRWNTLNRDVLRWLMQDQASKPEILEAIDEARRIFEPASAALVAVRATRIQLIEIETAYVQMEEAARLGDVEAAILADRAFHHAILKATGNPILEAFESALDTVLGLLFSVAANHMENFRANLGNHLDILEAIRRRDAEGAELAMRKTINFTSDKLKNAELM